MSLATAVASTSLDAQDLRRIVGIDVEPYLGLVASRCAVPDARAASGSTPFMSRKGHFARSRLRNPALVFANWYNAGAAETGSGSAQTIKASIEYPAGTFTVVTFGGSATGNMATGDTLVSDQVAVDIPAGAQFWSRCFVTSAAAIVYETSGSYPGDGFENSGATDKTTSGTVTQGSTAGYGPVAIIDYTTRASVAIIGDSKTRLVTGIGNTWAGEFGEIAPSLGRTIACMNLGRSGEAATGFITAHTKRVALAAYCSHVVCNYGINDLTIGGSSASVQASLTTIRGYFTQPFFQGTIAPVSTSTDSWVTTANQTTVASNANRVAVNTWLRAGNLGDGIFDIAGVVESSLNSGIWAAGYTSDGTHENLIGLYAIANGAAVSPARIVR